MKQKKNNDINSIVKPMKIRFKEGMKKVLHSTLESIIYICKIFLIGSVLYIVSFPFQYAFFKYMPSEYWVDYIDVIPVKDQYEIGEEWDFYSLREVKRPVKLSYLDVVQCFTQDGERLGSRREVVTNGIKTKKIAVKTIEEAEERGLSWSFDDVPLFDTECIIFKHTITPTVAFGIEKKPIVIETDYQITVGQGRKKQEQ